MMNETMNTFFNEAMIILRDLHFVRADWFYAFIPLILFLLLAYSKRSDNKNWRGVVDPQLQPFVLQSSAGKQHRYPLLLVFIAASLCITALAGPVYKKLPQPVYREQSSLVILLDLSQSMNATDIKPSRLARAKLELLDLLKARKTGQTALIVYAADAFVVTPLTDDNNTIANLVPSLETDMMPAQGSNLAKALAKTVSLFTQAGAIKGDILVITDDIHQRDESAIKKIVAQGYRLSIFGIGTTAGGPIPLDANAGGGFLQDRSGAIVIPRLQPEKLQRFALSGGGLYTSLQAGDEDVNKLSALFQSSEIAPLNNQQTENQNMNADLWQEEGHWLLLPLLFFASLWARRGWLAVFLIFMLPLPQPAYADGIDTQHLWSTPDQKAMQAFNKGDLEQAAEHFTNPEWKASALYRKGDYEAAAKTLENADSSNGNYNRGNALARQGKLEEAIKAYNKALEIDASNADARYNLEQVKQALKKQQQDKKDQNQDKQNQDGQKKDEQQQQGDEKQQDQQSQDQQSQNSQQQNDQQQSDQQQNSEQQDSQQQNSQQSEDQSDQQSSRQSQDKKDGEQDKKDEPQSSTQKSSPEQQQEEQEQLKQRDAEAEAKQQKKEQQQYQQNLQQEQQNQDRQPQDEQQKPDEASKEVEHKDAEEKPMEVEVNPVEASITEEEKATEQWLKRVPDDPGGLLRRKFYYQYKQLPNQNDSEQPW